ncbi:hypothetical protein MTX20_36095 [Bradyrhizobium sp. ISRA435]|nr:hypothetical protein MTX20_36095 [Bradyrhizobium sp. ISRA435]
MTELQASEGARVVKVPRIDARPQRFRDILIALAAFVVLALLPMLFGSKQLLDFVI